MHRFVIRENIKHFVALLERATDEVERKQIRTLLAEERRKQKEQDGAGEIPPNAMAQPIRNCRNP
jgi:hypothetical protein